MKTIINGIVSRVLGAVFLMLCCVDVHANTSANASSQKIAILDYDYVIQNAEAMKLIQKHADEKRLVLQKQVEDFENMLRLEEQDLQKLVNQKDKSAQDMKIAFENKVTDVRNKISERSRILSEIFGKAREQVFLKMSAVVKTYAESKKISVVLTSNVVLYQNGLNISKAILSALNQALPKVDLDLSAFEKTFTKNSELNTSNSVSPTQS